MEFEVRRVHRRDLANGVDQNAGNGDRPHFGFASFAVRLLVECLQGGQVDRRAAKRDHGGLHDGTSKG